MTHPKQTKDLVVEHFGENALRKSALSLPDGAEIFELVLKGKGFKTILEIGTYKGVSAAELSKYCNKVITVDLEEGQLERTDPKFHREKLWRALHINNINLKLVEDNKAKADLINSLHFDFAFVDGAHDEGVNLDWDLVKRCGAVLFHDYDTCGIPHRSHVYNLVNSLPKEQVRIYGIFAYWKKDGNF